MEVVKIESSTQTDNPVRKSKQKPQAKVQSLLSSHEEGKEKEKKLAQNCSIAPKRGLECQTSKARVMTRGQRLQVSKSVTTPSWMQGGDCLEKDILQEKQLKTQPVWMLCAGY